MNHQYRSLHHRSVATLLGVVAPADAQRRPEARTRLPLRVRVGGRIRRSLPTDCRARSGLPARDRRRRRRMPTTRPSAYAKADGSEPPRAITGGLQGHEPALVRTLTAAGWHSSARSRRTGRPRRTDPWSWPWRPARPPGEGCRGRAARPSPRSARRPPTRKWAPDRQDGRVLVHRASRRPRAGRSKLLDSAPPSGVRHRRSGAEQQRARAACRPRWPRLDLDRASTDERQSRATPGGSPSAGNSRRRNHRWSPTETGFLSWSRATETVIARRRQRLVYRRQGSRRAGAGREHRPIDERLRALT